jgi:hypothetical protein
MISSYYKFRTKIGLTVMLNLVCISHKIVETCNYREYNMMFIGNSFTLFKPSYPYFNY